MWLISIFAEHGSIAIYFILSLQAVLMRDRDQFCGGSLVDSTHVLTAAHCVD